MAAAGLQRLGFDAIRALSNGTGLGNYARELLRGLREHAPAADLLLYTPRSAAPAFAGFAAEIDASTVEPEGAWRAGMLRNLHRTFRVGRAARRDGVELYHGLTHEIPRDLPGTGIPSVVTFLDLIYHQRPELFSFPDRTSYAWRYRWSAAHADHIVVISEQTGMDLVASYGVAPARISVVPPAVDPRFGVRKDRGMRAAARARYGIPDDYLVCVGTLEPRKNQLVLLDALALLDPARTPPLVLIGRDGGSAAVLHRRAAALGIERRVIHAGSVDARDLPALVQDARGLLYPSLAEGFGIPIVEGLAAGIPVVASDTAPSREAGGAGAHYVRDDDAAGFASAIRSVIDQRDEMQPRVEIGTMHARGFDRRALAARLWTIYEAVVDRRTPDDNLARRAH